MSATQTQETLTPPPVAGKGGAGKEGAGWAITFLLGYLAKTAPAKLVQ